MRTPTHDVQLPTGALVGALAGHFDPIAEARRAAVAKHFGFDWTRFRLSTRTLPSIRHGTTDVLAGAGRLRELLGLPTAPAELTAARERLGLDLDGIDFAVALLTAEETSP